MNPSYPFDPDLHESGSVAAQGRCSHHHGGADCAGEAVVSFRDDAGSWHAGCSLALQQLVESGDIEPLGQGA